MSTSTFSDYFIGWTTLFQLYYAVNNVGVAYEYGDRFGNVPAEVSSY